MRWLGHFAMFWRWPVRVRCHQSPVCCQYVDNANCNNRSAPKEMRHR